MTTGGNDVEQDGAKTEAQDIEAADGDEAEDDAGHAFGGELEELASAEESLSRTGLQRGRVVIAASDGLVCVPVCKGEPLDFAMKRVSVSEAAVLDHLIKLLEDRGESVPGHEAARERLRTARCFAADFDAETHKAATSAQNEQTCTLPCRTQTLGSERFSALEASSFKSTFSASTRMGLTGLGRHRGLTFSPSLR